MNLKLIRPDPKYKEAFLAGLKELSKTSDSLSWIYAPEVKFLELDKNFDLLVKILLAREVNPPMGMVPDTCYWAMIGQDIVGRISLRHELNDSLRVSGGHIGYIVKPSFRGQGIATEMLKLLLRTDKAKQIGRLLLTCDEDNIASEKTISKNGGHLTQILKTEDGKPNKKLFWIDLNSKVVLN